MPVTIITSGQKNSDEKPHRREADFSLGKSLCDSGHAGEMQSAAAVVLMPLIFCSIHHINDSRRF